MSVLLINLRHALMAASLRPLFTGTSLAQRLGLAYVLTDEAFAMSIGWFRRGHRDVSYYVTFGVALWLCWNLGTIAGGAVRRRDRPPGAVRHRLRDHRMLRRDCHARRAAPHGCRRGAHAGAVAPLAVLAAARGRR